jgi:hypothetical protein
MNCFPKYDGSIHPDEWINDIKKIIICGKIIMEDF